MKKTKPKPKIIDKMINITQEDYLYLKEISIADCRTLRGTISHLIKVHKSKKLKRNND